jgi:hypothetical protein
MVLELIGQTPLSLLTVVRVLTSAKEREISLAKPLLTSLKKDEAGCMGLCL